MIALVAMTPIILLETLGLVFKFKSANAAKMAALERAERDRAARERDALEKASRERDALLALQMAQQLQEMEGVELPVEGIPSFEDQDFELEEAEGEQPELEECEIQEERPVLKLIDEEEAGSTEEELEVEMSEL
jgi:hypothetical protein